MSCVLSFEQLAYINYNEEMIIINYCEGVYETFEHI